MIVYIYIYIYIINVCVCIYIYIYIYKLVTVLKGKLKAPFLNSYLKEGHLLFFLVCSTYP